MKARVAIILAAVFSVVVLLYTYGTALPTVPFAPVGIDGPVSADSDGEFTAIADTESRRVLVLNADGALTGVVSCDTIDSPFDAVTDVCVSDGIVYISGVKLAPDSDAILKERIAMYDKGGNYQGVAFEMDGRKSTVPAIGSLNDAHGGVVAAIQKSDSNSESLGFAITFTFVSDNGSEQVMRTSTASTYAYDASYSSEDETSVALNAYGSIEDGGPEKAYVTPGRVFTSIDLASDGVVYACDDASGALCAVSKDGTVRELVKGDGYNKVHVSDGHVSLCDRGKNEVTLCNLDGAVKSSFSSVLPSIGFSLRMVLVWACGLYLVVLVLALAVRTVRRRVASGQTQGFGPMLASVAVVVALGLAVGGLSFSSYQSQLDMRAREIGLVADYINTNVSSYSKSMDACNTRDILRLEDETFNSAVMALGDVAGPLLSLTLAADHNGIQLYFVLYGKDDNGVFYLVDSSDDHVLGTSASLASEGTPLAKAFEEAVGSDEELHVGRTLRDATQYRLIQIPTPEGDGVGGVIEIGSKMRAFEASVMSTLAPRVLALLVMMLVVYMVYSELRACGRCMFSRRQLRQQSERDAIAVLTRPFTFCITILSGIDSAMTVLIARELLRAAGMGDSSPLLALPAAMLGVGLIIGQLLYSHCGSRIGLRRLMVTGTIAMLVFAVFAVIVVSLGSFWLYCAAKLLLASSFGLLYVLGYSLPRLAESDEARVVAAGGVKRTDTSAAALGTVLGGYAAQALGNAWVYVIVAIACIPVLIMALNLLPKGMGPLETEPRTADEWAGIVRFIKSRKALAIAFAVVLPVTCAAGYASFLFPLFSSDLGLTKADINNIFVLGQLVVYVLIDTIDRIEGRYGKNRVTPTAVGLIGVVFLLFSINTTLVWSMAVVAIVGVLCKLSDGWKALWLQGADAAGVSAGRATGAMFAVRSFATLVQPFVMGALLGATDSIAVIVLGVLCVVCSCVFFLVERGERKRLAASGPCATPVSE